MSGPTSSYILSSSSSSSMKFEKHAKITTSPTTPCAEIILVDIACLPEPSPDVAVHQGVRVVRVELVGGVSGHGITNEQWVAYTRETFGLGELGGFLVEFALEVVARGHRVADDTVCGIVAWRCVAVELHGRARGVPRALDGVFGDLVLVGNDRTASDGDCGGEDARERRRDDAGARDAATRITTTLAPASRWRVRWHRGGWGSRRRCRTAPPPRR